MRIACLAWGSLIWKAGPLAVKSTWQGDGPLLPIEFVRVGDKGELATTLWEAAAPGPTFWAEIAADSREAAREQLRQRESIAPERQSAIGDTSDAWRGPYQPEIRAWANARGLDLVVWTALPPRFADEEDRAPSAEEALAYLQSLQGELRAHAEHYIRHVPADIRTRYRAQIETRLGWHSAETTTEPPPTD